MEDTIKEFISEWFWLAIFGGLIFYGRKLENDELEENLGIDRGREIGMTDGEIGLRSLNSIKKYLKFGIALLLGILCVLLFLLLEARN